jgi:hypothetical protein
LVTKDRQPWRTFARRASACCEPQRPALAFMAALTLAACNNTDPTLGIAPAQTGTPVSQGDVAQASTAAAIAVAPGSGGPAATAAARLYVAPIIGSTVAAVTPLSRRLAAVAGGSGLTLVAEADPARTHVVKGYFSALPEDGQTTIIFVWDVFNPSGVRLHRIQGQEAVSGTSADPWSIVPPATMERIADRLLAEFRAWVAGQSLPVPALPQPAPGTPVTNAAPTPGQG